MMKMEYHTGKNGITIMTNKFVDVLGDSLDNIKTFENFLSEEEQKYIIEIANRAEKIYNGSKLHFEAINTIRSFSSKEAAEVYEKLRPMHNRITEVATKLYKTDFIDVNNYGMNIHTVNSFTDPHTDVIENGPGPQIPGYKEKELKDWRDAWDGYLACNVYINDDYLGGEVYFPERDFIFKPKARSVVFWPGNKYFIHGIKKTIKTNRYVYGIFIKFKDYEKYEQ